MRWTLVTLLVASVPLPGCSGASDDSSSSSSSSSSSGSSSGSAPLTPGPDAGSSASDGGETSDTSQDDAKRATCEAYADLVVKCCDPPVPQCGADRRDGWVDFCVEGYDGCPKAYDCLAKATCETKSSCPNFGTGCQ